tara:strand:- start:846 stop:1718 length:873 start_codon:yes stop_codon:yes gene_type:complete
MKILIIGRNGMIGSSIFEYFSKKYTVYGTVRKKRTDYNFSLKKNIIENIDLKNINLIHEVINTLLPDVVINCSGIIKQKSNQYSDYEHLYFNSEVPILLSKICNKKNIRLINLSTDCVFDGANGYYNEGDIPNATDIYGLSKIKGEINQHGCLTIRTSTIGLELGKSHGLIEWFLDQNKQTIVGYENAMYSGLTIKELSRYLEHIIINFPDIWGIYNMASKKISKYELLLTLSKKLDFHSIVIEKDTKFICDRSLDGRLLDSLTGFKSLSWNKMLSNLATDINNRSKTRK